MKAQGYLQHRFHGDYTCIVLMAFLTPEDAEKALPLVRYGFEQSRGESRVLVGKLTSEQLTAFKSAHQHRISILPCTYKHCKLKNGSKCQKGQIDSIPHSIDNGPPFVFDTEAVPPAVMVEGKPKKNPRQKELFK